MNRTPIEITPTIHTEGGEFRLDLIEDTAAPDSKHWRIVLHKGVLRVMLFGQRGDYGGLEIERRGMQYDINRGATRDIKL